MPDIIEKINKILLESIRKYAPEGAGRYDKIHGDEDYEEETPEEEKERLKIADMKRQKKLSRMRKYKPKSPLINSGKYFMEFDGTDGTYNIFNPSNKYITSFAEKRKAEFWVDKANNSENEVKTWPVEV